ncbi:MAG: sugar phosphate isomerase/epimerase [Planctomycetes bacterium]|nr:sugar phosphate isomerase/epimerase [Planctomycetota bacterium]
MAITYCFNTSTIMPQPLMDKIRIAGQAGYRMIELWNSDLTAHCRQGGSLEDVVRALEDSGLQVPTVIALHGWSDTTGEAHRDALEEVRRSMDQAYRIGAKRIIASPCLGKVDLDLAARNYRELLGIGREIGIMPAMEFLGFVETICRIEDAWSIVAQAQDSEATIVMDPFHIFRGGGPWETLQSIPASRIAVCHFNDAPRQPPRERQEDKDRVYPGDGHLPLKSMIRTLRKGHYHGGLSLELFNPEYWKQDPREVARTGLEKMRAVVESA